MLLRGSTSVSLRKMPLTMLRLASIAGLSVLGACSSTPHEVPSPTIQLQQPEAVRLPPPRPVNLQPISWKVISAQKAQALKPGSVYFALSPKDYEALSRNMAELIRWSTEARWQVDYYRKDRRDAK